MNETMTDAVLTPEEVAARLRLPVATVRTALRRGELPGALICRRWRVRRSDLDALFGARATEPAAAPSPAPAPTPEPPVLVGAVSRAMRTRGRPRRRA